MDNVDTKVTLNNKSKENGQEIVYSCSGCSTAAQMANYLAVQLDRMGLIEMSCIAGVGGDVPSLVNIAKKAKKILALDGCALQCTKQCLSKHGLMPTNHVVLSDYSVKKLKHQDFDIKHAEVILADIIALLKKHPQD